MKNLKYYILFFTGILLMTSCLHEEEDIFGKSAAQRLNEAQLLYQKILTDAPNGWVIEYVAGDVDKKAEIRGAFNFLVEFDNGDITASIDRNALDDMDPRRSIDPFTQIISRYRFDQDMGVTLSFDTYNKFLHYYHEQHGSYTTYKGDFEFTIMEAYEDLVILRGKKYGNIMEMHRMPADMTWKEYLEKANAIYDTWTLYPQFDVKSGATILSTGTMKENRQMTFTYNNNEYFLNALFTPTGMKFVQPLEIDGKELVNFEWDPVTNTFTCTDPGATGYSIQLSFPENYITYDAYLGDYTFEYTDHKGNEYTRTVTLKQEIRNKSYVAENFLYNLPGAVVLMQFNKTKGVVALGTQTCRVNGTNNADNLYPCLANSNFYANLGGEAYGRFLGPLKNNTITWYRDPDGSLANVTFGFRIINRVGTSNYGRGDENIYLNMVFKKQ